MPLPAEKQDTLPASAEINFISASQYGLFDRFLKGGHIIISVEVFGGFEY